MFAVTIWFVKRDQVATVVKRETYQSNEQLNEATIFDRADHGQDSYQDDEVRS